VDIEFLKTFLEVNRTRHFGKAASNLFVTQSTVSSRIKLLEDSLGAPLFVRARNAIELTPTGKRLLNYAENIVTTWNRARIETAIEDDDKLPLTIAGMPSLWDISLQQWLNKFLKKHDDYILQIEVLSQEDIISRLRDNTLDLGFVFDVPAYPELDIVEITSIPLVLVSNKKHDSTEEAMQNGYMLVDWGTSFAVAHARLFPELTNPSLHIGLGRIARKLLLDNGGSAYMPEPMVKHELKTGKLHKVSSAPVIKRAFYAAMPANNGKTEVLEGLLGYFKR
jgi:DNA-binding transcriptional LysR family regulator